MPFGGKSTRCSPALSYLFSTSELNRTWNLAVASGSVRDSTRAADIKAERVSSSSKRLAATWNWGEQPDRESLERCAAAIVSEQNEVCGDAASTTLFSSRLKRRLVLLKRHFAEAASEAGRKKAAGDSARAVAAAASDDDVAPPPPLAAQRERKTTSRRLHSRNVLSAPSGGRATDGLARLGSRAALSFAFAFLRRAWRSGEDGDLCTDLLEESLDALLMLPEASMFHAESLSPVWTEVVERTTRFLRAVVTGGGDDRSSAGAGVADVPKQDRHLALNLLLEFSVQKGTLREMLDTVMLLFRIWNSERSPQVRLAMRVGTVKRLESIFLTLY